MRSARGRILGLAGLTALLAARFEAMGVASAGMLAAGLWASGAALALWLVLPLAEVIWRVPLRLRLRRVLAATLPLALAGAVGLGVTNLRQPTALPQADLPAGQQLRHLYLSDQGDRLALRLSGRAERDELRRERVLELYAQQQVITAEQLFHAAAVLSRSDAPAYLELAYTLGRAADDRGLGEAEGLWQSAYDRWQLSQGLPQLYGTQSPNAVVIFGLPFEPLTP